MVRSFRSYSRSCSLKTSFLKMKLKPDYDGAATSLERAAVCYRNADQPGYHPIIINEI